MGDISKSCGAEALQTSFALLTAVCVACALLSLLSALRLHTKLGALWRAAEKAAFVAQRPLRRPERLAYAACFALVGSLVPGAMLALGPLLGGSVGTALVLVLIGGGAVGAMEERMLRDHPVEPPDWGTPTPPRDPWGHG